MGETLRRFWRVVKWPFWVLVVLIVAFLAWRTSVVVGEQDVAADVAAIHAQHITLADVMGETQIKTGVTQAEHDATVAGVDSNNNGIRDDVELAIFKKYPSDKKARAAALQYAMTEQMFLTRVYNTETWKAVAEENARAGICLLGANVVRKEIQDLVDNNQARKDARTESFNFITSHGDASGQPCDIEF